jgi:hypothetical protein
MISAYTTGWPQPELLKSVPLELHEPVHSALLRIGAGRRKHEKVDITIHYREGIPEAWIRTRESVHVVTLSTT